MVEETQSARRGPFDFSRPFPWSLLKLEVLENYSNTLAQILGGRLPICFVDLMAGEGYYDSGDLGSAGRLAALARSHLDAGRNVKVVAIEENRSAFAALEKNTAGAREFVDVRNGSWQELTPRLLDELRGWFVLFFVDPMGIGEIPWAALRPLVTRDDSELLINFNSAIAARLAGLVLSGRRSPVLRACFDGDSWVAGASEALSESRTPEHMARAYAALVHEYGQYIVARSPIAEYGDRGHHKYHLIFASRNIKGFEVMNNVLAVQHESILRAHAAAQATPMFPFDIDAYEQDRKTKVVRELAASLGTDESLRGWRGTIEDLRRKAFRTRFAQYKFMYYAAAVTLLVDEGQITASPEAKRHRGQLTLAARVQF